MFCQLCRDVDTLNTLCMKYVRDYKVEGQSILQLFTLQIAYLNKIWYWACKKCNFDLHKPTIICN